METRKGLVQGRTITLLGGEAKKLLPSDQNYCHSSQHYLYIYLYLDDQNYCQMTKIINTMTTMTKITNTMTTMTKIIKVSFHKKNYLPPTIIATMTKMIISISLRRFLPILIIMIHFHSQHHDPFPFSSS